MKPDDKRIYAVPTNIITGFLGVGKTTAILHLLKQKPAEERWAVLVNEFGEIGVDGGLMQGRQSNSKGLFVREVPGGCMCCAAGLPMQIALNQLLTKAKPHRLLIEPTGLGHPKEVLEVLCAEHYQTVLNIQQCITLVDARHVTDSRYSEHETFNQQIDIADIIIGNKADLFGESARQQLITYVEKRRGETVPIYFIEKGKFEIALLDGVSDMVETLNHHHQHHHLSQAKPDISMMEFPECGFLSVKNAGDGYQSIGWRFSPNIVFDRTALFSWLAGLSVERAKGIFITNEGIFGYNLTAETHTEIELDDCVESRMEIITRGDIPVNEEELLSCIQ